MLFLPLPYFLEKSLTPQIIPVTDCPFFFESSFNYGLSGDSGVVCAGEPEDLFALKPGAAGQDVLNGVIEHMAESKDSGHVGGRNDD